MKDSRFNENLRHFKVGLLGGSVTVTAQLNVTFVVSQSLPFLKDREVARGAVPDDDDEPQ